MDTHKEPWNFKKIGCILVLWFPLLTSCSDSNSDSSECSEKGHITRREGITYFALSPPEKRSVLPYPWEERTLGTLPKIIKEHFRCKGSSLNPEKTVEQQGKPEQIFDCGGSGSHSLPLREEQEFIYPILIALLNHIQEKTGKKVVITSGHRCPGHNTYVDPAKENLYSKHLIGAEVSFYVPENTDHPEKIVQLLIDYYQACIEPELSLFQRYEKNDTNVSTKPWYNKEIFIKLFKADEGRNFDNRHPYPYLSIQVRYDRDLNERVIYTWDKAHKNYHRK